MDEKRSRRASRPVLRLTGTAATNARAHTRKVTLTHYRMYGHFVDFCSAAACLRRDLTSKAHASASSRRSSGAQSLRD